MAYSATVEWDVRTTGSDANGGGFNTASSGTDYSQQNSPQVTYTDLVIDGTTNTKCTSAAFPFTSLHVGNIINVTSGTGFTVQRVEILSVTSGAATCDKSLGTLSSTGGNGKLGGSLLTVQYAMDRATTQLNKIHLKAGTYTITVVLNCNTIASWVDIIGYNATHNDGGTRPLITTATNGCDIHQMGSGTSQSWTNVSFSNTAGTRARGFVGNSNGILSLTNCVLDGFTLGLDGNIAVGWHFLHVFLAKTEIKNCSSHGCRNNSTGTIFTEDCYIHDNGGAGIIFDSGTISLIRTLVTKNSGSFGIGQQGGASPVAHFVLRNCTVAGNTGVPGVSLLGVNYHVEIENNLIYGNGTYGIVYPTSGPHLAGSKLTINRNNAYGANGTAARSGLPAGAGDVTLTADPFTNSAAGDYSLNATAGGGAACKAAGTQWA